jgi:hypothetical protein
MYALLVGATLVATAHSAAPVAMVLTTKGMATLERDAEKPRRLGAMTLLRPGDRVQVAGGGEVTLVFLEDGHRERLKPKIQATVQAEGCQPAEARQRLEGPKLAPANLESLRDLANSSRGAVGVLRGDPPPKPQVVTPLYGATIQTDRPALTWPDAKAEAYLVQLFSGADGKDKRLLWKATVKETRLSYPEKEKPLELGRKYQWHVIPLKGDDASADPIVDSKFLVLTKYEIDLLSNLKPLLASKVPADLLLAAVSYEAHGVYDEALRLYERLAELSPEEANFQVALVSYYDRAGRKDLAQKARERAKKLGAEVSQK